MSRRSRLGLTLLLSVLLHAALLFALSRVPSVRPPRPASREVVEFDIRQVPEKPTVPAVPRPTARPPAQVTAPPSRRGERPAPSTPETPAPQVATAPPAGESGQEDPSVREKPLSEDTPLASAERPILVPGHLLGEGLTGQPRSTGRTLRNTGEVPDPKAVARQQAEEARVKVDGWARDSLAEARAERGAPSPYFAKLQKDFTKKLVDPPPPDLKVLSSRMKREQVEAIQRFGKTGSPYASKQRDQRLEQRNRFQAAVEAGRAANMYMVDVTEPILALAAVVEVRQARDGKVLELEVIEGSGDSKFDDWAVSQLREALASAEAPQDGGVGIHDEGMRSRWRLKEFLGNPRVQIHLIGVY
ncbi:ferrichrome ABC transporter substrate-binding protein [Corallococcus llansteffanensis]|uniref:Ferrichrome ABC transporter substrate-binding protein n=1 Tax=Corallococcus llansteffanensis TaxID=2316731 RepID=A0A3A8QJY5_9BACT|nr:ferrichrome ABC transporter substrate-binding protein [Corallococcus llansteffanensis]RKH69013.1 ferrichrome ABC transporter substrate-binding protein [Corallococcus llansteffanensis]